MTPEKSVPWGGNGLNVVLTDLHSAWTLLSMVASS